MKNRKNGSIVYHKDERGGIMRSGKDFLIISNNPLAHRCMGDCCEFEFLDGKTYRDVLVKVRDLVYAGHTLFTHPLAGSVKPNETPYRSVVVSKHAHEFSEEQSEIIANSIIAFDKFPESNRVLSERVLGDFQLVDYTLLAGAMDFDARAGLAKIDNTNPQ